MRLEIDYLNQACGVVLASYNNVKLKSVVECDILKSVVECEL